MIQIYVSFQEWSANYWASLGAPKEKLIIGLATYGRTFTLKNENDTDLGAPVLKAGYAGPFSKEPGLLSYAEVEVSNISVEFV